ncbi:MAG: rhodanese-like domain-containing protein [Flavobacteriaceae bacterium]|nr:rhodanese-like domain-containing protein [Flavobacteriaceae bacterium]
MKNLFLITVLLFTCFFYNCKEQKKSSILQLITSGEMEELLNLEDVQLVDVRTPSEFNAGHVPDAQNINFYDENFDQKIETLDKSKPIIVYCKSGGRSAKCASKLVEKGFEKIYDLEGGFSQWKFKGLTIEY